MTIPINPKTPRMVKKLMLTPEINKMAIMVITRITPVPKSGWSIISPKRKNTTNKIGNTDERIFLILLLVRYLDVNIIRPNLANSLG